MSHCGSGLSRRAAGCGALDLFPREPILLYSYERLLLLSLHYPCQGKKVHAGKTRLGDMARRKNLDAYGQAWKVCAGPRVHFAEWEGVGIDGALKMKEFESSDCSRAKHEQAA